MEKVSEIYFKFICSVLFLNVKLQCIPSISTENPKCDDVGCGEWEVPMISNPDYKGKWKAPMIDNPNYKGEWKPRRIENPQFFEDLEPFRMTTIVSQHNYMNT